MKRKRKIGFILEAFLVLIIMAALSSIAIPKIAEMMDEDQSELRTEELADIRMAVAEMLADSQAKTLRPVGPTRDMGLVQTADTTPLVLADYLSDSGLYFLKSECSYSFTSYGEVAQDCP